MTTFEGFCAILAARGSSQPLEHSQCASKNVNISPFAAAAPLSLALISPCRLGSRIILTIFNFATYCSSFSFNSSENKIWMVIYTDKQLQKSMLVILN